ncbi:ABC-type transport system involved in resistance to organic solvents, auxiliary component [Herbaspirillum sp. CF444]|uniref:MlaC/ttg2D family ABC transporter substrate-binding protein n=1 Tax=Herbaspirillum sp. CF444 TaxID=1144319 RepID=UPI00027283F2|nr:ABC transporter substrate-binding protein [Herbaspirillum sp. CF444]EJL88686.1 ABC-type transport system involved in resistance to organic solvents, auxiliary component [Herbaspirillum sp. CF444]
MNMLSKLLAIALSVSALTFASAASAQEAPDALVKRISEDVLNTAKSDKDIQAGNIGRIVALVEEKILPYVDSERMTALAAGRYWRQATPEQQKQLMTEFRSLLIYTYSGALSQVRDQKIEYKPLRADPADTEVEVRSQVIQSRGEPIQLSYRLEKLATGWKLYDVNVMGAWLVEAYKGTFQSEITKGGIDGLIKSLSDKNKQLAARSSAKK